MKSSAYVIPRPNINKLVTDITCVVVFSHLFKEERH